MNEFDHGIRLTAGPRTGASAHVEKFTAAQAEAAMAFHRSFPEYRVTPLAELRGLAGALGLGAPVDGDPRVISGESGASTAGLVSALCSRPELSDLREQLELDESARVLCFSTEGDTDRANYRRVVWQGAYPEP